MCVTCKRSKYCVSEAKTSASDLLYAMQLSFVVIVFAFCLARALAGADYYKILGLSKGASEKDIKSAYRTLSKKYHPDKNPGDDSAHNEFIKVGEAYEVLSDPEKKQIYDQYGEEGLKNGGRGGAGGAGGAGFDPFADFFGFGGGQRQQGKFRGRDTEVAIDISLRDAYRGTSFSFEVEMQNVCDKCSGTGSADGKTHTCQECQGHGIKIVKRQLAPGMFQQFQTTCDKCNGKGKTFKNKCNKCAGHRVVREARKFDFYIEPGTPRGHIHKFAQEGDHSPDWISGDLLVNIGERGDNNLGYRRRFNNLYRTEAISFQEAMKGNWTREIKMLGTDETITLERKMGQSITNGEIEVLKGKGMPKFEDSEDFGDLIVEYVVILPLGVKDKEKYLRDEL